MHSAILLLLMAAGLAAQTAGVAGTVTDQSTAKPLAGVNILLVTGNANNATNGYGATSDAAGHFSVKDMKPGLYIMVVERVGYVQAAPKGSAIPIPTVTLKADQHVTDFKIEMQPRAIIAGRVVDEYGDPVQNVQIQLQTSEGQQPINVFGGPSSVNSDDRGEFRVLTAPGKYYVQAMSRNYGQSGPAEIRTDGTSGASYAATYYPSSPNKEGAALVDVAAGADRTGVEIRLMRAGKPGAPSSGLTLSGMVMGVPPGAQATVQMRFGDTAANMWNARNVTPGPDGKFSIGGLQPCNYRLYAQVTSKDAPMISQMVNGRLESTNESNIQLALAPAGEVTGTVEFVGGKPAGKMSVKLEGTDSNYGNYDPATGLPLGGAAVEIDKEGAFHMASPLPGKYQAKVEGIPENAYVQSVSLDGMASDDSTLDLSRGARGSRIKITVNSDGGQISGRVLDKDGDPVVSFIVMIFFGNDPEKVSQQGTNRVVDAKYSYKRIRPGKYRLFAVDPLAFSIDMLQGNASMKPFYEAGEEIEIKPGDRIVKDVKVLAKESVHVK